MHLTDNRTVLCCFLLAAAELAKVNTSGLAPGILLPSPLDPNLSTYQHQRLSHLKEFLTSYPAHWFLPLPYDSPFPQFAQVGCL